MTKIKTILTLLLLNLCFSPHANADEYYLLGSEYIDFNEGNQLVYLAGFIDSINLTLHFQKNVNHGSIIYFNTITDCAANDDVSLNKIRTIVNEYMNSNRESWDQAMAGLVLTSLDMFCMK